MNSEALKIVPYKGVEIQVHYDRDADSPRTWGNIGTMVCFHGRYNLGDKHDLRSGQFSGWDEMEEHLIKAKDARVILPLYLYDHSGITISTGEFSCRWDSGQVGFIYADREAILNAFGKKRLTKGLVQKAKDILEAEVKIYDQYLRGEVYGYVINHSERMDLNSSCWGYYNVSDALEDAMGDIDASLRMASVEQSVSL